MKAKVLKKKKSVIWILMFLLSFFVVTEAKAHWCHRNVPVPVAFCKTAGTNIPLPNFVCCQKLQNGHHVWRDTWVATSCKNADPKAIYDMGCKIGSPVYETGMPLTGDCQFSFSTGKYI